MPGRWEELVEIERFLEEAPVEADHRTIDSLVDLARRLEDEDRQ